MSDPRQLARDTLAENWNRREQDLARELLAALDRAELAEARVDVLERALFRVTCKLREYVGPRHPTVQAGDEALVLSGGSE